MYNLSQYIVEKLKLNKDIKKEYNYFPKDKKELMDILYDKFHKEGKDADLSDIDTSNITEVVELFLKASREFNALGFENIDLSHWDMSNVKDSSYMFSGCTKLKSIGDVSSWDMSNVTTMEQMFYHCRNLNIDNSGLENWDVSNVKNFRSMFMHSDKVNFDLKKWKINKDAEVSDMIGDCISFSEDNIPLDLPKNAR